MAERRPIEVVLAETRLSFDIFSRLLDELSLTIDELEVVTQQRQSPKKNGTP